MARSLEDALNRLEPAMRRAFLSSVRDVKSSAQLAVIVRALQDGRIDDALRALNLGQEFFGPLDDAIRAAFMEGGRISLESLPALSAGRNAGRLIIRFDGRHERAERYLASESSRLIRAIVNEQRSAIRSVLEIGLAEGRNPRSVALDVVGRISRATGRREGGLIGLSPAQINYVSRARAELASGDPKLMQSYLGRQRRDARFDGIVKKAIRDGKKLSNEDIDKLTTKYSDRLLKLRGDTIARTETLTSLHAGQHEAMEQLIETGAIRSEQVRRIWRSAGDGRVRDSHADLNGETVGLNEKFSNGLLYPGEPGGPAEEVINCRCVLDQRIDFLANQPPR